MAHTAGRSARRAAAVALGLLALCAAPAARGQTGPSGAPEHAVFQLQTLERGTNKSVGSGTAFFTASDGTALTVSHVVYRAQQDPGRYDLVAIVEREFFSVQLICASRLAYDPTKGNSLSGIPYGRDVAQIRVIPSQFSFRQWILTLKTGEKLTLATAHGDAVPAFPYLTLAAGPSAGQHIRVVGFGQISPIPRIFVATGEIDQMTRARDGTEIFSARFTSRPQPGNSGSPVLDEQGHVIGIWPWVSLTQSEIGVGISSSALQRPCP